MKKLIALLALLAFVGHAAAAVNFVTGQSAKASNSSGGTSLATTTFSSSVTTGNVLLVFAHYTRTAGSTTCTFTRSGDSSIATQFSEYNSTDHSGMCAGYITGVGANTNAVTVTYGVSVDSNRAVFAAEVSGGDTTLPIGSGEGAGAAFFFGTAIDTGNGAPTVQPGKRYGVLVNFHDATHAAGAGFTARDSSLWDFGFGVGFLAQFIESDASYTTTGSQSGAQWTVDADDYGHTIMVFVREASSATAKPDYYYRRRRQ